MNQRDMDRHLSAVEARLLALERGLTEIRERHHDLADVLNEVSLKMQLVWAERKAAKGPAREDRR